MRLDKKQRRLAAVVLLGGAAVFTDRVLLGGGGAPAAASADVLIPPEAVRASDSAAETGGAPAPRTTSGNKQSVADRLNQLRDSLGDLGPAADAFAIPPSWRKPQPGAVAQKAAAEVQTPAEERFRATYTVRSIVMQPREQDSRLVLSSGQVMKVGDEIDGWRLASITRPEGSATPLATFVSVGGATAVNLAPPLSLPGQ